jgi:hypothetical protein
MTRCVIESQTMSLQVSGNSIVLPSMTTHFALLKRWKVYFGHTQQVPFRSVGRSVAPGEACQPMQHGRSIPPTHNAAISLPYFHQTQDMPP